MKTLSEKLKAVLDGNDQQKVICEQLGENRQYTLKDLNERIDNLNYNFAKQGFGFKDKIIGIAMDTSFDWISVDVMLASTKNIALPVPLDFSDEQLSNLLKNADYCFVDNLLVAKRLQGLLPNLILLLPDGVCYHKGIAAKDNANLEISGDQVVKIIHTSGTTSLPKGVLVTDEALGMMTDNLLAVFTQGEALDYLSFVPMSLLLEQIFAIYLPLLSGGCVKLKPKTLEVFGSHKTDLDKYLKLISEAKPNFLYFPPVLLEHFSKNYEDINYKNLSSNKEIKIKLVYFIFLQL